MKNKKEKEDGGPEAGAGEGKTLGALGAGLALIGWGIYKLVSASSDPAEAEVSGEKDDKKKMKAPGKQNEYIYRDDFEGDPRGYFRKHRNKD